MYLFTKMKVASLWKTFLAIHTAILVSTHSVRLSIETSIAFEPHNKGEPFMATFNRFKHHIARIFAPFQDYANIERNTYKDYINKTANVLRNYQDDHLKEFTKILYDCIGNYVNNRKGYMNYSLRSTINGVLRELSDVQPNVLKDKLERVLKYDSYGVFDIWNTTCTKNETELFENILLELKDWPQKQQNLTGVVVKAVDYLMVEHDNLNDTTKKQLHEISNKLLEYFGIYFYNDNYRLKLDRNEESQLVKSDIENAINDVTGSLKNKATTDDVEMTKNDLNNEIVLNKNIEISVRSTQSDYI